MKIAFVCDAIFPYHRGGRETRLHEITTRLANLGHEIHIYTMNWWSGSDTKKENGVILHGVCRIKNIYTKKGIRSIWSALYFSIKIFYPILISNYDIYDVDHMPFFQLYSTRIALWLKNKKMFATWHEVWGKRYWQHYLGNINSIFAYLIEKVAPCLPDKIISVSDFTSKKLTANLKTKRSKIITIQNGINYEKIANATPHQEKSDIIYIGRLLTHKQVDKLIEAIKTIKEKLPSVKCFIIGQGPEYNNLKTKVRQLELINNIKLLGFVPDQEAYAYLKSSKLFISASIREGFGIATMEAQAAGLPAIIIDHPDNASVKLITHMKNGLICQDNTQIIAGNALDLLNKPDIRSQMRQNALEWAKKYNWPIIMGQLEKVYLEQINA